MDLTERRRYYKHKPKPIFLKPALGLCVITVAYNPYSNNPVSHHNIHSLITCADDSALKGAGDPNRKLTRFTINVKLVSVKYKQT